MARSSLTSIVFCAVALTLVGLGGCEVRPLRSADLYGAAGAGAPAGAAGRPGTDSGTAGAGSIAGAGGLPAAAGGTGGRAGSAGSVAGAGGLGAAGGQPAADAAVDQGTADATPDAPVTDGGPDAAPSPCPQTCASEQFCDELMNRCVPRTGTGMLSGGVVDPCTGNGLDARIAIAGQRECSAAFKGSYFFSGLPLGRLKLAAFKDGYELYGATVEIVPGGVIHEIRMVRAGGCGSAAPVSPCTCTEPSCDPITP